MLRTVRPPRPGGGRPARGRLPGDGLARHPGGERVSPEAKAAVEAAVREIGYRPNQAARSLVTRRTDSIAVVIPESDSTLFTDPFFATSCTG